MERLLVPGFRSARREHKLEAVESDIVDLAEFRAAKVERERKVEATASASKREHKVSLSIVDDRIVLDHEALDHVLTWDASQAITFGEEVVRLGHLQLRIENERRPEVIELRKQQRAEAEARARRLAKFRTVKVRDASGKVMPPLKVKGWALETFGGHTGADAPPVWVRMSSPRRRELDARRLVDQYIEHGYAPDKVRVVAVDYRGRIIPPERMPAS